MPMRKQGLYIHVPFCRAICAYCDFKRIVNDEKIRKAWLKALHDEIRSYDDVLNQCAFDTLYFGGGTPSLLPLDELKQIMEWLKPYCGQIKEVSIEANGEDINEPWIKGIMDLGFNRLSIGLESSDNDQLKAMHRNCDYPRLLDGITIAKNHGLTNINVDVIYGLPNSTLDQWQTTLALLMDLNVPHISMYALSLEADSIWGRQNVKPIDEELMADMMEYGISWLNQHGYHRYEISNFTKDKPSYHNLHYWHYDDFIGLGFGASGKWKDKRYDHCDNPIQYIHGDTTWKMIDESIDDIKQDYIMMNTRLKQRFEFNGFNQRFADDFYHRYAYRLNQCKAKGFIDYDPDGLTMTDYGLDCQFSFLDDLLDD